MPCLGSRKVIFSRISWPAIARDHELEYYSRCFLSSSFLYRLIFFERPVLALGVFGEMVLGS